MNVIESDEARIVGTSGADFICGNALDNVIVGKGGADIIYGGAGADKLTGGGGADELFGGEGNDVLRGSRGADSLVGGAGDDKLLGNRGDDMLDGGAGDDTLLGGKQADDLDGGDGNDTLKGGSGRDTLDGGAGDDVVRGGGGKDTVIEDETPDEGEASPDGDYDTTPGIEAAQWGDNVTITLDTDTFRFESNGIPSHEIPDEFLVPQAGSFSPPVTPDEVSVVPSDIAVVESPVDETITIHPTYSDTTSDSNLGLIGVTISGAQLFNDYEDQERSFVALDDNFSIDGVFFVDSCNGHPGALRNDGSGQGNYHYHGIPYCLTDIVDAEGEHSSVLGFLIDGFPFYGPQDENGVTISSDELDECSGHVGATPEFPEGIYHYHLTDDRSPYTVDCFHGEVTTTNGGGDAGGPPGGGGGGPPGRPPADDGGDASNEIPEGAEEEAAMRTDVLLDAQWADSVTVSVDGNTVSFSSDGLPSHEYLDAYLAAGRDGKTLAGGVDPYDATFSFPLVPVVADAQSETGSGAIGVAISGATFFDPYEANGDIVANDDNETIEGVPFIDPCGGHPIPSGSQYHYHGIPFCITDSIDTAGQHSVLIGYLFDGFPIYGPQGSDGSEPTDLDACLGHTGETPEFDSDTYHYHVTSTANYISECLNGIV